MPGEELVQRLLEQGVESWNAERDAARKNVHGEDILDSTLVFPDLSGENFWWASQKYGLPWPISLVGVDFAEADLSDAMLRLVNLGKADFSAAILTRATLNETQLVNANLEHALLEGTDLEQSNLTGADLRGAVLTDADLRNADVTGADLTTTNMLGANLSGTNLWEALLFPSGTPSPSQYRGDQGSVTSISSLLDETRKLKRHYSLSNEDVSFYFRGEPKCGWSLTPSVMRSDALESEGRMLLELMSRRPEEFSVTPSALSQWVLAQHHGLKTRFLDITKNPMIALFHACESNERYDRYDANIHIFAVPNSLVKPFNSDTISVVGHFAKLSRGEQEMLLSKDQGSTDQEYRGTNPYQAAMDRLVQYIQEEKPYFQNRIDVRDFFRVFVVEPQQMAERVRVQSGAFLVSAFHEQFEREEIERRVINVPVYAHYTLPIPQDRKPYIVEDLQLINIKRETLYPGLDEAAKAITNLYEPMQTSDADRGGAPEA